MLFLVVAIVVPLLIYNLLPPFLSHLSGKKIKADTLLLIACLIYLISWFLPSPLIEGQNTSFTTHFVGGGIFTGLIWLYCLRAVGWKRPKRYGLLTEAAILFAAVSSLGVLNELFELFAVKTGVSHITLNDTIWDLLANTSGALLFFIVYSLAKNRKR